MAQEAERLRVNDHSMQFSKPTSIQFCGGILGINYGSANDLWFFSLHKAIKEIGINSKQLPRLSWELLLWGKDGTDDH